MVLLYGGNGQGKTNILEAIYLLAVVKSPRASSDRDLVRREALERGEHSQVSAVVQRDGVPLRVVIGLQRGVPADASAPVGATEPLGGAIQKQVRVNGAPRRVSDLVGEVNAVLFTAQDMGIVLGPPFSRRRYVDILISQVDSRYLRLLQKSQQVMTQRNQLLKAVRDGRSQPGELEFWDGELVEAGALHNAAPRRYGERRSRTSRAPSRGAVRAAARSCGSSTAPASVATRMSGT